MAKIQGKYLDNRKAKLWYRLDDASPNYTELGNASNFTGPRGTINVGEGMSYEDEGHRYPVPMDRGDECSFALNLKRGVARPTFVIGDYAHFVIEESDGYGTHVFGLITALDKGSRSPNGLPQWQLTLQTTEDAEEIAPAALDDFLTPPGP